MTRSRDLDPALLARYLSGECTPAEAALVRAWAASDPAHRAELDELRRAWSSAFPLERPIDIDAAWHTMATAMHRADAATAPDPRAMLRPEHPHADFPHADFPHADGPHADHPHVERAQTHPLRSLTTRRSRRRMIPAGIMAAAAAIALAFGIRSVARTTGSSTTSDVSARILRSFATGPGQRALIDLADGTHIVLAPGTRLRVSLPVASSGTRELTLDGEAMFTVTHDVAHPFVVRTRYGTTIDVGTSFAVRAYTGEPYRVVVREGRVELGGAHVPILVAGDVVTRDADGTLQLAHAQDAASLLDWADGHLTFEHTRFGEIVPELERWYGVQIRIATPALRNRVITGQFDTESRSEAMDALSRTLGAQHTTDGQRVTFSLPRDAQ